MVKRFFTGNCWKTSFEQRHEQLRKYDSDHDNFHFLNNSFVVIEGQRFIGATGWFNPISAPKTPFWCDYMYIDDGMGYVGIQKEYFKTKEYLEANVEKDDVVVTHHLAVSDCVALRWQDNPDNGFFVSGFDEVIYNNQPKLWLGGHSHDCMDIQVNNTRFIINAFGYPHEYSGYSETLLIEV